MGYLQAQSQPQSLDRLEIIAAVKHVLMSSRCNNLKRLMCQLALAHKKHFVVLIINQIQDVMIIAGRVLVYFFLCLTYVTLQIRAGISKLIL
jgi:hypothetical protein